MRDGVGLLQLPPDYIEDKVAAGALESVLADWMPARSAAFAPYQRFSPALAKLQKWASQGYDEGSIPFTRSNKVLRFHDLRHEATIRLFKRTDLQDIAESVTVASQSGLLRGCRAAE